jgi:hypothetical protein
MRKLLVMGAGLVVVLGCVSWGLWRQLRSGHSRTIAAPAVADSGQSATVAASTDQSVQAAPRSASPEPVAVPPRAPSTIDMDKFIAADAARRQAQMEDTDYRKALLERLRVTMPREYPGLAEELALTTEEAGRLFDVLAEVQVQKQAANANNSFNPFNGGAEAQAAVQRLMQERQLIQRRQEDRLTELLGSARYEQFRDYEASRPARARLDEVGRTLAAANQALGDEQSRSLKSVFIAEEKRRQEFLRQQAQARQPGEPVDQLRIDEAHLAFQEEGNRRIIEAAQAHLDARQLETLRAALDRPLAGTRAAIRARREQAAAQP